MVKLGPGRYLLAYTQFQVPRDDGFAVIAALRSSDRGTTWSSPAVLQDNSGAVNVMAPSLRRLRDGGIGFSYIEKNARSSARMLFRRSDDNGESWSAPVAMTGGDAYTVCLNDTLVQLPSGRILQPIYQTGETWTSNEAYQSFAVYSDDGGKTWQESANRVACPGRGAMEPVVFLRPDGVLVMLIRTDQGQLWRATSSDEGRTWSPAAATEIVSPQAPAMVTSLPTPGHVVLCYNNRVGAWVSHGGRRNPLVLAVSTDAGETWSWRLTLEDEPEGRGSFSYPSLLVEEGHLFVTYYSKDRGIALGDSPQALITLNLLRLPLQGLGQP